jgi:hypothetical protein
MLGAKYTPGGGAIAALPGAPTFTLTTWAFFPMTSRLAVFAEIFTCFPLFFFFFFFAFEPAVGV